LKPWNIPRSPGYLHSVLSVWPERRGGSNFLLTGPPSAIEQNDFGTLLLKVLLYASFVSCAFWIYQMRVSLWFAVRLLALFEVPVLAAAFVAGMSVTGDWL